jgi:hypothetical protein
MVISMKKKIIGFRMQRCKDENDCAIVISIICQSILYGISCLVRDGIFFIFVICLFFIIK